MSAVAERFCALLNGEEPRPFTEEERELERERDHLMWEQGWRKRCHHG